MKKKILKGKERMKKHTFILIILLLSIPLLSFSLEDEYYRKAALFKVFSQYVQWPDTSDIKDQSKPFIIGVIGENPFGSILENAYSQEENKIKEKQVIIQFISKLDAESINKCHILFISKSVKEELEDIIYITKNRPILTIGETKGFSEKGVLFNLYISRNDIRFEINGQALQESQLIVDSQLLSVAKVVKMTSSNKK